MTPPNKATEVVPSVQMPSADLINFRFDQSDKNFAELKDMVGKLTTNFITREEMLVVQKQLDNYRWYWRAIFSAVIVALATSFVALFIYRR